MNKVINELISESVVVEKLDARLSKNIDDQLRAVLVKNNVDIDKADFEASQVDPKSLTPRDSRLKNAVVILGNNSDKIFYAKGIDDKAIYSRNVSIGDGRNEKYDSAERFSWRDLLSITTFAYILPMSSTPTTVDIQKKRAEQKSGAEALLAQKSKEYSNEIEQYEFLIPSFYNFVNEKGTYEGAGYIKTSEPDGSDFNPFYHRALPELRDKYIAQYIKPILPEYDFSNTSYVDMNHALGNVHDKLWKKLPNKIEYHQVRGFDRSGYVSKIKSRLRDFKLAKGDFKERAEEALSRLVTLIDTVKSTIPSYASNRDEYKDKLYVLERAYEYINRIEDYLENLLQREAEIEANDKIPADKKAEWIMNSFYAEQVIAYADEAIKWIYSNSDVRRILDQKAESRKARVNKFIAEMLK